MRKENQSQTAKKYSQNKDKIVKKPSNKYQEKLAYKKQTENSKVIIPGSFGIGGVIQRRSEYTNRSVLQQVWKTATKIQYKHLHLKRGY